MTTFEILVGAPAFWRRAAADIAAARRRVYVQAMSFEGDAAGLAVAAAIAASGAADRRVLVDDYSRRVVNDRPIRSRLGRRDRVLQAEVAATDRMFRDLAAGGAPVRVTNPIGPLGANYPARNHKKLIVADHVAWLGGVNFCDHNFAWHDFMLRLEGEAAADFLAGDFAATFAGAPRAARADLGDLALYTLDGRSNAGPFAAVTALIGAARQAICIISPYLTFPVTTALAAAARRGVAVQLITPWANNKPIVRDALLATARRAGFDVRLTPGMSHLKGLLVDDTHLIVGSSNFDFVSLAAEEELMAVITAPAVIADFHRLIIAPALREAKPPGHRRVPLLQGLASGLALRIADQVARAARNARRTAVDW